MIYDDKIDLLSMGFVHRRLNVVIADTLPSKEIQYSFRYKRD